MNILGFTITKSNQYKALEQLIDNKLNKILYQYSNNAAYVPDANNETYIEKGYKGNLQVYSVVSAITRRCTGLPFKHMQGETEIKTSELIKLFDKPNPMQSRDEFIEASASWLLLTGNLYWYTIRPENGLNKGKITEMYCLPAHLVEIVGGGVMQPVKEYRLLLGYGQALPIDASQVIHIKYFNPGYSSSGEQLYGMSPLQAAIQSFSTTNSGYTALNKAYGNGSPAGIVTGTENSGLDYTPEQAKQLADAYNRQTSGAENVRRLLFSRNPLQFIKMGWSPIDMDIIEHLKFSMEDICNVFQAPIHLFSAKAATLDNYKEARKAIYTDCVMPFFDRLMPVINNQICPAYAAGSTMTYDTSQISELNADVKEMATALSQTWWLTGNERREMMGLEEHSDPMMNEILMPSNLITPLDESSDNRI